MTCLVDVCNDAISLRLSLTSEQFTGPAGPVTVLKLPIPLSFACKARNLSELGGGELQTVYVFKRIDMDPLGFDAFARNLCRAPIGLKGSAWPFLWPMRGLASWWWPPGGRFCLLIRRAIHTPAMLRGWDERRRRNFRI